MARNFSSRVPTDEIATPPLGQDSGEFRGAEPDDFDSRLLDLEPEPEPSFRRAQKRVAVRRGALPRKAANRIKVAAVLAAAAALCAFALAATYRYGAHSWRFRLDSSDLIEVEGTRHVGRAQIMEVMGGDIGRNVFFIPLDERRKQLEQIPWVESASVGRLLPDRIRVDIRERVPVAFARIGSKIELVDSQGVMMDLPRPALRQNGKPGSVEHYSFPVILGVGESEPASTRQARMEIYRSLIDQLDSTGAHYSKDLSEVDLSDPDDVKVTTTEGGSEVQLHLGNSNFLQRYQLYIANAKKWREQYPGLRSVDLRYDQQVVLDPDRADVPGAGQETPTQKTVSGRASKASAAARTRTRRRR